MAEFKSSRQCVRLSLTTTYNVEANGKVEQRRCPIVEVLESKLRV